MVMILEKWTIPVENWTNLRALLLTNQDHIKDDYTPFDPLTYCYVPVINYIQAKKNTVRRYCEQHYKALIFG